MKWITDPEVMKYVGFYKKSCNLKTPEEAKEFCTRLSDGIFFGIYTLDDNLIGYTTLSHFDKDECEFGIFIGEKEYWGKGIGLRVTKLMTDYAFSKLGIKRVILTTCELHNGAIKMYKRAGFVINQIIKNDRTVFIDGTWQSSGTIKMEKHNACH